MLESDAPPLGADLCGGDQQSSSDHQFLPTSRMATKRITADAPRRRPLRRDADRSPVRIVWLSHFVPWPPRGGALQRSHHLLRRAAAAHEVRLVALNQRALLAPEEVLDASKALTQYCASAEVFPIPSEGSRLRWASMVAGGLLRTTPYDVNWLLPRT